MKTSNHIAKNPYALVYEFLAEWEGTYIIFKGIVYFLLSLHIFYNNSYYHSKLSS